MSLLAFVRARSIAAGALAIATIALPALAQAQTTLRFEVEGLDLDTGDVISGRPDVLESSPAADLALAYNSSTQPHAVVVQNKLAGAQLARLSNTNFADVGDDDIAALTFTSELIDAPFAAGTTVVVKTEQGAYFKIGNPVESGSSVSFDVALLRDAPAAGGFLTLPSFGPGAVPPFAYALFLGLLMLALGRRYGRALPRLAAAGALLATVAAGAAFAQAIVDLTETNMLVSGTSLPGDLFGTAVAASGDTVVVTAAEAVVNGVSSGAAYVFVRNGSGWALQQRLLSSDPVASDFFGGSVAIDGDTIAVGDWADNTQRGAVYVYKRVGSVWTQEAKLVAGDANIGDSFGWSVAISGNTIFTSALSGDAPPQTNTGAAYVFTRTGSTWTQLQKITAPVPTPNFFFGIGVDLDGNRAVVGTRDTSDARGAVYVYERTAGTFVPSAKVVPQDPEALDTFGDRIAVQGNRLLVAAPREDELGTDAGAGYVFEHNGTNWQQRAKLLASTGIANDRLGILAASLDGDTAVLSAPSSNMFGNAAGVAYTFARQSDGTWTNLARLHASNAGDYHSFGCALAIEGGSVFAGARFNMPQAPLNCGPRPPQLPCPPQPQNQPGFAYEFVIDSIDSDPPVLSAPVGIWPIEATSSSGAAGTFTVTALDEVDGPIVPVCVPAASSIFGFGDTAVTCTATDAAGNASSASFTVRVADHTAPAAVCTNVLKECTGPMTDVTTSCTATDAADPSLTVTSSALTSYPVGFEYYVCSAHDDAFNFDAEQCSVQIVDTTPPTCEAPGTGYVACSEEGGVSRGQAFVSQHLSQFAGDDLCDFGGVSIEGPTFLPSGCAEGLASTISMRMYDESGNQAVCSTDIVVYDNAGPLVTVPAQAQVECNATGGVSGSDASLLAWLGEATASDRCHDEVLTHNAPAFYGLGTTNVLFSAQDSCGNTNARLSRVSVLDTTPPAVSCANAVFECTGALTPVTTSCSGADVCDGSLALASDAAASYALGAHAFSCEGQDDSGNVSSASCQVTVVDTTAAVIAPIVTTLAPVAVGTTVSFSAPFTAACGVHTGSWSFGDGTTGAATVSAGTATGSHVYTTPGVYTVALSLADGSGNVATATHQYVVVYDPSAGFVTGAGVVDSPAGAYTLAPAIAGKASFGFVARYAQGATTPTGNTQFRFRAADFEFESESYEWLVIAGADAKYKGAGRINGVSGYRFMLTATDGSLPGGGGQDRLHLKVWSSSSGGVIYDNEPGLADDAKASHAIAGGNIVIHAQ